MIGLEHSTNTDHLKSELQKLSDIQMVGIQNLTAMIRVTLL